MNTLTTCEDTQRANLQRLQFVTPPANLHHNGDGYTLEVEMPGVAKDGVEITIEDGKLTIVGHRASAPAEGRQVYSERSAAEYRRVFDLDPGIDTGKVSASMDQGLLTVRLHKAETAKPRKITVE
jgi:HSP20 family protein